MKKELAMEGKNVTLAVESGLKELGLRRDQVEVQVLEEGAPGFLGIGAKPARVLLREKRWGEEAPEVSEPPSVHPNAAKPAPRSSSNPACTPRPRHHTPTPRPQHHTPAPARSQEVEVPPDPKKACETAELVLREFFPLMGVTDAAVRTAWDAEQVRVRAEIESPDSSLLVGKDGKTLEAFQFLVTVTVGRRMGMPVAVQVDTEGYWLGVESRLASDIEKAVAEVQKTGRSWRFEPMSPAMRRLIHRKLMNHPAVETASEGEGTCRKVVVKPRR
ncbi:MAG: RNA-binding cell elongation regulator Jag/EloR [Elusimicrobiota bacterium]|jgi:spoIIIJ-associated protein